MKKLYELEKNELKNLYETNDEFSNAVYSYAYDDAMVAQGDEYDALGADVFEWHDHYSSFYLSTPKVYGGKAPEKVAGNLNADYMTPENAELYAKLCELNDKMENAEEWDEERPEYEEMTKLCDELADGITAQLRAYEEITDEQIDAVLDYITDNACYMSEWETDGAKVFEHITKIYQ